MDLAEQVIELLRRHPAVHRVTMVGSRQRDEATLLSDWDFEVETNDFERFRRELPELIEELRPLGKQWDRLSSRWNYMLLLRGPAKVDIIVDLPHQRSGPWIPETDNLQELDHHFWDWIHWVAGKRLHGNNELVRAELEKMSDHLLRPLGVGSCPSGIEEAVVAYRAGRTDAEARLGIAVDERIEEEVTGALREAGFRV